MEAIQSLAFTGGEAICEINLMDLVGRYASLFGLSLY
jgi:hypothetical protein